jgi:hypothetical protein
MREKAANPVLRRLDMLVGEWTTQAMVGGRVVGTGRTAFQWTEGGAFLVGHAQADPPLPGTPVEWVENSPFPVTTMMGLDDSSERFCMLYADGRGVLRVYQMSLAEGVWKLWRDSPGFFQRFTGTFGDDGRTINAFWEGSRDGSAWEHDFDLIYTRAE